MPCTTKKKKSNPFLLELPVILGERLRLTKEVGQATTLFTHTHVIFHYPEFRNEPHRLTSSTSANQYFLPFLLFHGWVQYSRGYSPLTQTRPVTPVSMKPYQVAGVPPNQAESFVPLRSATKQILVPVLQHRRDAFCEFSTQKIGGLYDGRDPFSLKHPGCSVFRQERPVACVCTANKESHSREERETRERGRMSHDRPYWMLSLEEKRELNLARRQNAWCKPRYGVPALSVLLLVIVGLVVASLLGYNVFLSCSVWGSFMSICGLLWLMLLVMGIILWISCCAFCEVC